MGGSGRSWELGDPARVLERRQEGPPRRSCAGCGEIELVKNPFGGRRILRCKLGEQVGERCNKYRERARDE